MTGEENILFIISALLVFSFPTYIYLFYGHGSSKRKFLKVPPAGTLQRVVIERLTGFLLMGLFPGMAIFYFVPDIRPRDLGLVSPDTSWILPSLLFLGLIILFTSYYSAKPAIQKHYPQIREIPWNRKIWVINSITWILYLLGYEFFFRSLLIFPMVNNFGIVWTLIVNVILYSLAHLHKSRQELAGACIFGIFLVLVTIYSGSVWIPFLCHLTLALSNDYFSYRYHKKIRITT